MSLARPYLTLQHPSRLRSSQAAPPSASMSLVWAAFFAWLGYVAWWMGCKSRWTAVGRCKCAGMCGPRGAQSPDSGMSFVGLCSFVV